MKTPRPYMTFRIGRKTSIVPNISRSNFVRALINAVYRIRIVDLVKLSLDSDVVHEIVRRIEAISLEVIGPVVSIRQVEHCADLQISSTRCGRIGLAVEPGDS